MIYTSSSPGEVPTDAAPADERGVETFAARTNREPAGTGVTPLSYNSGDQSDSATFGSLPAANRGSIDIAIMVTALAVDGQESGGKTVQIMIQVKQGQMLTLNADALRQIATAVEEMSKSQKSGDFGKILGWVAAAVTLVVAILTVNPVLMAVAVISITMMALQESGHMEKLAEKLGPEGFMAFMITMTLVMVVVPFLAPAAVGGAVSTATSAANTATQASRAAQVTSTISANASGIRVAGALVEGSANIGAGAAQIDSSIHRRCSEKSTADSERSTAEHEKTSQELQLVIDFYIEFMEKHESNKQQARDIIREAHESNKVVAEWSA